MAKFLLCLFMLLFIHSMAQAGLQDGLVGWWKFDESSGNAVDSSGQGNTGTPTGTTIVSNCKRSGCRSFNGSTDRITMSRVLTSVPYTISAWINPITAGTNNEGNAIFYQGTNSNDLGTMFMLVNTGGTINTLDILNQGGSQVVGPSSIITLNVWQHVAAKVDISGNATIYVNGIIKKTGVTGTTAPSNNNAYIGFWYNSTQTTRFFNGQMDDIRVYNRDLSDQEVLDLYKSGIVLKNAVLGNVRLNQ